MEIIDEQLLNELSSEARTSPRLRMNHNFHHSLDEKCHRFLNALEPGTSIPILSLDNGHYGVNIPKNVWHTIQCVESAILFECKEGPFVEHEVEGVMEVPKQL